MKTLKDHTILYDAVCPLCQVYTKAFVQSGMLDREGREPYQESNMVEEIHVDKARLVNEIALVNRKTGKVEYGIQSLFHIIGHSFPFFQPLFRWKPFAWLMEKLYKFISFNRRIIMPSLTSETTSSHEPSFNLRYRITWLVFTWLVTAFSLHGYNQLLTGLISPGELYREGLICGGQIFWQVFFLLMLKQKRPWDYLGNLMTISLAGSLVLLLVLFLHQFIPLSPYLAAGIFALTAGAMLLEHIRRTRILGIHGLLSFTWVAYRILLLLIILP
jgi:predicted DCC family thiol-disulfide oxidoreductase YuxK